MGYLKIILILILSISIVSAVPPSLPTLVKGMVKNSDGLPVSGINVEATWMNSNGEIKQTSTKTDSSGSYAGYYNFGEQIDAVSGSEIKIILLELNFVVFSNPGSEVEMEEIIFNLKI